MAEITIYGSPASNYVRAVLMGLEEKAVAYDIAAIEFGSPEHLAVQPFGKIPAMAHGDFHLYEASAILRYIDDAFDGPALTPTDAKGRAQMEQWISAVNDYYDTFIIRQLVVERFVKPMRGGTPDEAVIAAALPKIANALAVLDKHLESSTFLAGDSVSIADLMMAPIIFYLGMVPDGAPLLEKHGNIKRWSDAVFARPSFQATMPPAPEKDAAE